MLRVLLFNVCMLLTGIVSAVEEVKTIIHTDHLGSPIIGRSMEAETVFERHHEPYGSQIETQGEGGAVATGYTGHLEMRDHGLVYAGARWYDPVVGRFLSPDPVRFGIESPVSFNRYAYANDNPYQYLDPDGRSAKNAIKILRNLLGKGKKTTVNDLLRGSRPGKQTNGRTTNRVRQGGANQANKDFDGLNPRNVKDIDKGRIGYLDDGSSVNVRVKPGSSGKPSTDGRPTLEIMKGKNRIKFRYD